MNFHFLKSFSLKIFLLSFFTLALLNHNTLNAKEIETKLHWDRLAKYHDTLTEQEFRNLVDHVYSPDGALYAYLNVTSDYVDIFKSTDRNKPALFRLYLAKSAATERKIRTSFKNLEDYRQGHINSSKYPLRGLRILLDPGHIGGDFAVMEQRIFHIGDKPPITEADLNLKTAFSMEKKLKALGARVFMTKSDFQPVTKTRPEDFYKQAEDNLRKMKLLQSNEETNKKLIRKEAERLFYRTSEIEARAELANRIRPDFTICIHFNAAPGTEYDPTTRDNRLVTFVHGCYEAPELEEEEQLYRLFSKLLEGSHDIELAITDAVARNMAKTTHLPHVDYPSDSPHYRRINGNPYIYTRNLAANRMFSGPVIYLEPYYQNNPVVYKRALAGDYKGKKTIEGKSYPSLFREYSDSVVGGILKFAQEQQKK